MRETLLKVENIECEGCEKRIEHVLQDIEGITYVEANHNEKTVLIHSDREINWNKVEEELEDIGFPVIKDKEA